MINSRFDKEDQVLYISIEGDKSIENMTAMAKHFAMTNNLPSDLKVLEIAIGTMTRANPAELCRHVKEFVHGFLLEFNSVKHAVVTDHPHIVAYLTLIREEISDLKYSINVFSTQEAAREWLLAHD